MFLEWIAAIFRKIELMRIIVLKVDGVVMSADCTYILTLDP